MIRRSHIRLRFLAARFARAREGSIAVMFALLLIPVIALVGAAVDYSRAAKARAQLRAAVDAATLAAAQKLGGTYEERQHAAYGALQANLASSSLDSVVATVTDTTSASGSGVTVDATGVLPTFIMGIVGVSKMDIGAKAEALAGTAGAAEIALVLDNTGSMINDMPALKAAASNFVNSVFSSGGGANVKMSVVPYVAAVNVGSDFPVSALELTGTSGYQGSTYRAGGWIAYLPGCVIDWGPPVPAVPSTDPPPPPPPPIGSPIGQDNMGAVQPSIIPDWLSTGGRARAFAQSLFGVSRAAADVTANSVDPIHTHLESPGFPYIAGQPFTIPDGGYSIYGCTLGYSGNISNLELFNRMPGTRWKGCVEARVDPLDVNDDPPIAGDPFTRFVPYFAPDEPDLPAAPNNFRNNYLSDWHSSWGPNNTGAPGGLYNWHSFGNMFKYDMVNVPTIVETPPTTKGPNANCPDPLLRLTNNKAAILAKINSLNYWQGGGTISSEGLMWGWRTITPNAPFADGAAYSSSTSATSVTTAVKKHIVLMTDGLNSLVENFPNRTDMSTLSDYTAYGFLASGRLGVYPTTFPRAESILNERMLTACTNAKAKGISISTILFRETDQTTKDLLKACASTPRQALLASDAASLSAAFASISAQISAVRLAQ